MKSHDPAYQERIGRLAITAVRRMKTIFTADIVADIVACEADLIGRDSSCGFEIIMDATLNGDEAALAHLRLNGWRRK